MPDIKQNIALEKVYEIYDSVNFVANAQGLSAKVSYRFGKLAKALAVEIKAAQETINKLIKDLGGKKDDGSYEVLPENLDRFNEERKSIMTEGVEVSFIPLDIKEIMSAKWKSGEDWIKLSGKNITDLEPFLIPESIEAMLNQEETKEG